MGVRPCDLLACLPACNNDRFVCPVPFFSLSCARARNLRFKVIYQYYLVLGHWKLRPRWLISRSRSKMLGNYAEKTQQTIRLWVQLSSAYEKKVLIRQQCSNMHDNQNRSPACLCVVPPSILPKNEHMWQQIKHQFVLFLLSLAFLLLSVFLSESHTNVEMPRKSNATLTTRYRTIHKSRGRHYVLKNAFAKIGFADSMRLWDTHTRTGFNFLAFFPLVLHASMGCVSVDKKCQQNVVVWFVACTAEQKFRVRMLLLLARDIFCLSFRMNDSIAMDIDISEDKRSCSDANHSRTSTDGTGRKTANNGESTTTQSDTWPHESNFFFFFFYFFHSNQQIFHEMNETNERWQQWRRHRWLNECERHVFESEDRGERAGERVREPKWISNQLKRRTEWPINFHMKFGFCLRDSLPPKTVHIQQIGAVGEENSPYYKWIRRA